MLSLSVVTLLFASLVSLVPGKKLLVETGSNQAASVEQEEEFGSDYSDYSGNQNANLVGDHGRSGNQYVNANLLGTSGNQNANANVYENPKPYGNQNANLVGDHGRSGNQYVNANLLGTSGNQNANANVYENPKPYGNQNANLVGDHAGSGNQVATLYQNRAHASVPKLPSLDVFNNPKQYNTKPKNRVGLADFLYQRSPTTLSEVPFQ